MKARYNAVIVGQTGVGKSSLINYLYGQKVAEAGVGKPVTKNGFHPIDFEINGLPVCLFDSWGLEVGSYEPWMRELENEFKQRGVNESAEKWFHSVFYCIQAGGARIQDCDITIINKFIAEKYKVSVILTKCDQVDLEVEEALKAELQNQINGLSVISICSEEKKNRAGVIFSEPFGRQDIERQAFNDFFDSLILRLPLRCKSIMEQALEEWVKESKIKVKDNVGFGGRGKDNVEYGIRYSAKELQKKMQDLINIEIKKTFEMYGTFSTLLGYPPSEFNDSHEHNEYSKIKKEVDLNWWEWSIAIALLPIVISWALYSGKGDTIEELEKYIGECEGKLNQIIEKYIEDVTKMLETAKLKVTEKIKRF